MGIGRLSLILAVGVFAIVGLGSTVERVFGSDDHDAVPSGVELDDDTHGGAGRGDDDRSGDDDRKDDSRGDRDGHDGRDDDDDRGSPPVHAPPARLG